MVSKRQRYLSWLIPFIPYRQTIILVDHKELNLARVTLYALANIMGIVSLQRMHIHSLLEVLLIPKLVDVSMVSTSPRRFSSCSSVLLANGSMARFIPYQNIRLWKNHLLSTPPEVYRFPIIS